MGVKLYLLVSLVCAMTLCWKTSEATKCYECTVWARKSDDIPPGTCAGGEFNKLNETDRVTYVTDCGSFGCYKQRLEYADDNGHDGIVMYKRSCANSKQDGECKTVPDKLGMRLDCFGHGDYGNGAVLHTRHVIIALVTSVLTVILSRRGHE